MQTINLKPDDLDERNREFSQVPLKDSVFLNSVPKSGSHLLRNIFRMFVPVEDHYTADFIQYATLQKHLAAFDGPPAKLSWGHLFFSDISAISTSRARKLLLVRDPYSWVLSKARFMLSNEFTGELDILKTAPITADQLINLVIFGIPRKNPSLSDTYTHNAAAWLGTDAYLVRYEELVAALSNLDSDASDAYFLSLFEAAGMERPDDWHERVLIGSDKARSGTASENLSGLSSELPAVLNDTQKQLVDYAAPGLRALLGYD